ncbi:MAG: tRNA (guanosine(46)-N7)-methyltransferase TrmB [Mycoplasma sp.]|nr:tRNA (guanosine(46)-N7)-methyltransferase TrmB [Candidatus Hennigella equi]
MGRLRTNINAPELIKKYSNYVELDDFKLTKKQINLEIGCGKGDFLINNALNHKDVFYLGIEKYSTVILKALKKIERNKLQVNNLLFTCADAKDIDCNKLKHAISRLYLNFSDPWPKKRHAKRRLTSPTFLDLYKKILKDDGQVEFKTDNDGLYQYSLEVLESRKDVKVIYKTTNLYKNIKNKFNKDNVQTEYEKKFVALNKNINKIVWSYK